MIGVFVRLQLVMVCLVVNCGVRMIQAFVGKNGGGKTLAMTMTMALRSWQQGRLVISNYRLYPERLGYPAELWRPLGASIRAADPHSTKWMEVPRLGEWFEEGRKPKMHPDGGPWSLTGNKGCTLLLDEVTAVLPARDAVNVPPELQRMLNQFRKPDVWVGWAAPAWERADLMLREVTQTVMECRPMFPAWTAKHVPGSMWPQQRVFQFVVYDAAEYEEAHKRSSDVQKAAPAQLARKILWKPKEKRVVFSAYDTREGVDLLDHIQCEICGGKFSRKVCRGHEDEKPRKALNPVPITLGEIREAVASQAHLLSKGESAADTDSPPSERLVSVGGDTVAVRNPKFVL